MLKNYFCVVIGFMGSILSSMFGGWSAAMTTLVIFMMIDYITGVIVAGIFHNSQKTDCGGLKSIIGWQGICRKVVTLAIVLVACRLDMLLGTTYIKDAVVIAFCANEILSIVENAGLMGLPMPDAITRAVEVLKERGDGA